jgi:hypothetical protein
MQQNRMELAREIVQEVSMRRNTLVFINADNLAAMSLAGELRRRKDRIITIFALGPEAVIASILEEFKDSPEITAELRKLFAKASF